MGTWGTGPFDSDLAGDFVDGLSARSSHEIADALQQALKRVVHSGPRVDGGDGAEAVAAAALIAAQVPGGGSVIDSEDGPEIPLPQLPASLRALAAQALRRVLGDGSELTEGWVNSSDAIEWRQGVTLILQVLTTRG
ncbi:MULTISPECIES: DUF4259 domain-containing protein [unclassified Streptomyces]|uniref:DUF4259 domain-containing protein n=1 Tax=unclassified Streptomyces TaxID=2593676 RepID=UPI003D8FD5D7